MYICICVSSKREVPDDESFRRRWSFQVQELYGKYVFAQTQRIVGRKASTVIGATKYDNGIYTHGNPVAQAILVDDSVCVHVVVRPRA